MFTYNTIGGATQVAAQEKEELQPSGIYETHSKEDKGQNTKMIHRRKLMGSEPVLQK